MLSPSLEDYLEELYRFSLSQDVVRVTDLSQKLGVSLPSVSKALSKLKTGQYINYQRYGMINLTELGRKMGGFLVGRNQILQEFLTLLGIECNVGAEVEGMEHYFSRETIEAIQWLVKFMEDHPEVYEKFLIYMARQRE